MHPPSAHRRRLDASTAAASSEEKIATYNRALAATQGVGKQKPTRAATRGLYICNLGLPGDFAGTARESRDFINLQSKSALLQ